MTNREKVLLLMSDGEARTIPEASKKLSVPQSTLSDVFKRLVGRQILKHAGTVNTSTYSNVNMYRLVVPYDEAIKPHRQRYRGISSKILGLTFDEPMTALEMARAIGCTEKQVSQACVRLCKHGDLKAVGKRKGPKGYMVTAYEPKDIAKFTIFNRVGKINVMGVWV
jgi:predicted ArsR family transcriptional regulator